MRLFLLLLLPALLVSSCGSEYRQGEPEEHMQGVLDELSKLNFAPFWGAMPPSWQKDITGLVQGFGRKVDPDQYQAIMKLVERVRNILRDKMEVLLKSPIWREGMGDGDPEAPHRAITLILESQIGTLDGLQSIDIGKFLSTSMQGFVNDGLAAWGSDTSRDNRFHLLKSMLSKLWVEDLTGSGSLRTMRLHGMDEVARIVRGKGWGLIPSSGDFEVMLHEGCWVPRGMHDRWSTWMARGRRALDRLREGNTPQDRQEFEHAMEIADRIVRNFESAESSRDVNQALGKLFAQLMKRGW